MGKYSVFRESKSAQGCILLTTCYRGTPCSCDQTQYRVQWCWDTAPVLDIPWYSFFNTNSSNDMAIIARLISERSLHRQLPWLRTAYRSQIKNSLLAAGTKRVVTNDCTNTLYYRTAVEFVPDGNIKCPSRIEDCARVHSPDGWLPFYSLSSLSNSM